MNQDSEHRNEHGTKKDTGFFNRLSLPGAIIIVVIAASLLVGVGFYIYWNDSNRKYDLARPGEKDQQVLKVEEEEADTTSAVNEDTVIRKKKYLEDEIAALEGLSDFSSEDLSSENIQLVPTEQPSL